MLSFIISKAEVGDRGLREKHARAVSNGFFFGAGKRVSNGKGRVQSRIIFRLSGTISPELLFKGRGLNHYHGLLNPRKGASHKQALGGPRKQHCPTR